MSIGYSLNTNRVQIVQDMQRSVNDSSGMFASCADSSGNMQDDSDKDYKHRYVHRINTSLVVHTMPTNNR